MDESEIEISKPDGLWRARVRDANGIWHTTQNPFDDAEAAKQACELLFKSVPQPPRSGYVCMISKDNKRSYFMQYLGWQTVVIRE